MPRPQDEDPRAWCPDAETLEEYYDVMKVPKVYRRKISIQPAQQAGYMRIGDTVVTKWTHAKWSAPDHVSAPLVVATFNGLLGFDEAVGAPGPVGSWRHFVQLQVVGKLLAAHLVWLRRAAQGFR